MRCWTFSQNNVHQLEIPTWDCHLHTLGFWNMGGDLVHSPQLSHWKNPWLFVQMSLCVVRQRFHHVIEIMYEGLYMWMKKYSFVLERKVLLKLEKDLRKTKKFKGNGQTLFTTKSGWALKEIHFNLDGADLLD